MIRFSGTLREDHVWRRIFAPSTSPAGLAGWGILLAVAYGVVHALGWREHTGFLSLTASPGLTLGDTAPRGTVYLLLHFGAVLGTPSSGSESIMSPTLGGNRSAIPARRLTSTGTFCSRASWTLSPYAS